MRRYDRCYIDGEWVEPAGTAEFELVNPTTEMPFATLRLGNAADVDRAVGAARRAFPSFSATTATERAALLQRIVEQIQLRQDAILSAVTEEMGAPITMKAHVGAGLEAFTQAIVTLRDYEFETTLGSNLVRREPIGVCGLITAWNWPVQLLCVKLAAAFAAGCTVVAKPSEFTPTSAALLAEALHAAGLPNGVFNLVNGDGPTVGNAIASHPDIDMVSFTGSTRAGILVAQAAAPTVKRVSQELGGKSANVILPGADVAAALRWNVSRGFSNAGQSCHAPTRILVQAAAMDQAIDLLRQEADKVRPGDPSQSGATMGPVVNRSQFDRIQGFIERAIAEGARVVCGGPGRPDGCNRGYFVRPTIFADVTPEMTIAQEEVFGPVLAVMPYETEEDAIRIANGTAYGLGGYVFAPDMDKALAVARRIRAGRVFINGAPGNPVAPMGGYKQSGNGREMGVFGLEEYLEVKAMIGYSAAAE